MINTMPDVVLSQSSHAATGRGDGAAYRLLVDAVTKEMTALNVVLLTTVPRGGLQILQPVKLADTLVKPYVREWQSEDDSSWKAINTGRTVKAVASSRYVEQFLRPFGVQYVATAPVRDPIFAGYPGALQVHRTGEQGPFSEADLAKITAAAARLGDQLADVRAIRAGDTAGRFASGWTQSAPARLFAFDPAGTVLSGKAAFNALDDRLRDQILTEVKQRTTKLPPEPWTTVRLLLPDSANDHWTLNAVVYHSYPALSAGPVVFICLQPTCPEWSTLRAGDFQADPEMSRLVPALRFMAAEFNRGPTLTEIAKTVHLSPFHFHRRFTELMGLTPKHFMLECQIYDAKGELVAGEKELAKIASDCGFAHQSHFTSRFKQATGLTPTRWRRMAFDRINGVE
jgi:AraC-like DNA-binding protein